LNNRCYFQPRNFSREDKPFQNDGCFAGDRIISVSSQQSNNGSDSSGNRGLISGFFISGVELAASLDLEESLSTSSLNLILLSESLATLRVIFIEGKEVTPIN
jgi:hypothetical protein